MIEQLPPGRKLDGMVAEKVMGWLRPTREFQPWDTKPLSHTGMCLLTDFQLPRFSTDIKDAMKVWDKVAAGRGWGLDCDGEGRWWSGNLTDESVPRKGWDWNEESHNLETEGGESAAHAICLAALAVIG